MYVYIGVPRCIINEKGVHSSYRTGINVNVDVSRGFARSFQYIMHQLIETLQKARPEGPLYLKKMCVRKCLKTFRSPRSETC